MNPRLRRHEHLVYRMYGEGGRLLYIGATSDMTERLRRHRCKSWWFGEVLCVTSVVLPDRRSAFDEEAAAIRAEQPLYNVYSKGSAAAFELAAAA